MSFRKETTEFYVQVVSTVLCIGSDVLSVYKFMFVMFYYFILCSSVCKSRV